MFLSGVYLMMVRLSSQYEFVSEIILFVFYFDVVIHTQSDVRKFLIVPNFKIGSSSETFYKVVP